MCSVWILDEPARIPSTSPLIDYFPSEVFIQIYLTNRHQVHVRNNGANYYRRHFVSSQRMQESGNEKRTYETFYRNGKIRYI